MSCQSISVGGAAILTSAHNYTAPLPPRGLSSSVCSNISQKLATCLTDMIIYWKPTNNYHLAFVQSDSSHTSSPFCDMYCHVFSHKIHTKALHIFFSLILFFHALLTSPTLWASAKPASINLPTVYLTCSRVILTWTTALSLRFSHKHIHTRFLPWASSLGDVGTDSRCLRHR